MLCEAWLSAGRGLVAELARLTKKSPSHYGAGA